MWCDESTYCGIYMYWQLPIYKVYHEPGKLLDNHSSLKCFFSCFFHLLGVRQNSWIIFQGLPPNPWPPNISNKVVYFKMSCRIITNNKSPENMQDLPNQDIFYTFPYWVNIAGQSCYSCRAFFRRTSPRPVSSFSCRSGLNNCSINSGSKSCIPCRLTKCLQVSYKQN